MKTDEAIAAAVARGHRDEEVFADHLRTFGLTVETRSHGFRATVQDIITYASDIDLCVNRYHCQYKHRPHARLQQITQTYWGPFVDEKVKADRTPVDFYILAFGDKTVVAPYTPKRWKTQRSGDVADQSTKAYYLVHTLDLIPLETWITWIQVNEYS